MQPSLMVRGAHPILAGKCGLNGSQQPTLAEIQTSVAKAVEDNKTYQIKKSIWDLTHYPNGELKPINPPNVTTNGDTK